MKGFNIGVQNAKTIINIAPKEELNYTTIRFVDAGQDFLEWDVDNTNGKVLDCRPFQAHVWCGLFIADPTSIEPGDKVQICAKPFYAAEYEDKVRTINYPVERVTRK